MSLGLIVKTGRILTARLLMGEPIDGITHCAIGDGGLHYQRQQAHVDRSLLELADRGVCV